MCNKNSEIRRIISSFNETIDGDFTLPIKVNRFYSSNCPSCNSSNVGMKVYVSGVYGAFGNKNQHLIQPTKYFCGDCKFNSNEPFTDTNFINNRNKKIEEILNV